jgi:hypothetical protein
VSKDPKSNVVDICAHPKFAGGGQGETPLADEDIAIAGIQDMLLDSLDPNTTFVGDLELPPLPEHAAQGNGVCYQCTHRKDTRSWWRKLVLFRPGVEDYVCEAAQQQLVAHPVTGEHSIYPACAKINPAGHCKRFEIDLVGVGSVWEGCQFFSSPSGG